MAEVMIHHDPTFFCCSFVKQQQEEKRRKKGKKTSELTPLHSNELKFQAGKKGREKKDLCCIAIYAYM